MSDAKCGGVINSVSGTNRAGRPIVTACQSIAIAASLFVYHSFVRADDAIINYDLITLPTDLVAVVVNIEDDISILQDYRTQIGSTTENTPPDQPDSGEAEINTEIDSTEIVQQAALVSTPSPLSESESASQKPSETVIQVGTEAETGTRIVVAKPVAASVEANVEIAVASALPKPVVEPEPDVIEAKPADLAPEPADSSAQASASDTTVVASSEIIATPEPKQQVIQPSEQAVETTEEVAGSPSSGTGAANKDDQPMEVASISDSSQSNDNTATAAIAGQASTPDSQDTAPQVTEQQEQRINEDEIILAWATAWSNNDVEQYLSFYAREFKPSNPKLDRKSWEQLRRKRLKNQEIRIIVSNAEIYRVDNDTAEVRFTQRYTSKGYRDRVIKSIEMIETEDGWKFLSERTLEELPFK